MEYSLKRGKCFRSLCIYSSLRNVRVFNLTIPVGNYAREVFNEKVLNSHFGYSHSTVYCTNDCIRFSYMVIIIWTGRTVGIQLSICPHLHVCYARTVSCRYKKPSPPPPSTLTPTPRPKHYKTNLRYLFMQIRSVSFC